jgi:hypothetical protein
MYNTQFLQDFITYQKGGAKRSIDIDIDKGIELIGKIKPEERKIFSVSCKSLTCGTGRIRQIAGTCGTNANVNALLMSDQIFNMKMKKGEE